MALCMLPGDVINVIWAAKLQSTALARTTSPDGLALECFVPCLALDYRVPNVLQSELPSFSHLPLGIRPLALPGTTCCLQESSQHLTMQWHDVNSRRT